MRIQWLLVVSCVAALAAAGCAPQMGDACAGDADCSLNGDRTCDRTQPNGYCTVEGCEQDTCPGGALCVEFRPDPPRLASRWCMAPCGGDGDCRSDYVCRRAEEILDADCRPMARSVDSFGREPRFCVARGTAGRCGADGPNAQTR